MTDNCSKRKITRHRIEPPHVGLFPVHAYQKPGLLTLFCNMHARSCFRHAGQLLLLTLLSAPALAGGVEDQLNYIAQWKDEAVRQMVLHRIPASITLAQGLLESGSGKSELSSKSNNHFGIKCHADWEGGRTYYDDDAKGECFRVYDDARDSYEDHSLFLKRKRYESLFQLKIDDYKGWAKGLKRCGYATSPTYAKALIELIERHDLGQHDEEGMAWIRKGEVPERPGVTAPDGEDQASEASAGSQGTSSVRIGAGRSSGITENDVTWVTIKAGESLGALADQLDLGVWQLRKYNDLEGADADTRFDADRTLYTQPKRRRGVRHWHVAEAGETLRQISDAEAVKLKVLVSRTGIKPDAALRAGQKVPLRFAPKEDGSLPWFAWGGGGR